MKVIIDTTVLIHMSTHQNRMRAIVRDNGITELYITRINYLELLSGASMHSKTATRKVLQQYPVIEFDAKAAQVANKLAMLYMVGAQQSKDFLIAAIAIANRIPLLTENSKDFGYTELSRVSYKILQ